MASRTRKATHIHSSYSSSSHKSSHGNEESSKTAETSSSPIHAARLGQSDDKLQLQHLNDRLASYIERNRQLENENNVLKIQLQTSHEQKNVEITSHKALYEKEVAEARKLLDETAQEKTKLQIEANTRAAELQEVKLRLNKKEKEHAALQRKVSNLEADNQEMRARLNNALSDKDKLDEALKDLKDEVATLAKQLAAAQKQLEQETLLRVTEENKVISLKEELAFRESVHEKELSESRIVSHTEVTELDGRLKEHYEQQMADNLRELRENYEQQIKINREEVEEIYKQKLDDQQRQIDQLTSAASIDELYRHRSRAERLESRVSDLEGQLTHLTARNKDLERLLEQEREWHRAGLRAKDDELRQLREQMDQQMRDYEEALTNKGALRSELAVYEKLLEAEESRLNISMSSRDGRETPSRSTRATPLRAKRKRTVHTEEMESQQEQASAKGEVEISEQDSQGQYVRLHNKSSSQEVSLAGWVLAREADDLSTRYKFGRSIVLKPGATLTVWSSGSGTSHSPASGDLLMKSGQNWPLGRRITTTLLSSSGEEMATRHVSKKSHSSHQDLATTDSQLQSTENGTDERCCVM